MKKTIHIALVSSNVFFRKGLSGIIAGMDAMEVVQEAENPQALAQASKDTAIDVCIADSNILEQDTARALLALQEARPHLKVLLYLNSTSELIVSRLVQAGCSGYITKHTDAKELHRALLCVHYAGNYFPPGAERPAMRKAAGPDALPPLLTPRETELLALFCTELSYIEIAELLGTNVPAVETYRNILMDKLRVTSRVGLATMAFAMGIPAAVVGDAAK